MTFPVPGGATFMRAGADYVLGQNLASGEVTVPRFNVGSGPAVTSQQLHLTYWTAVKTETVNNIGTNTGSTAAGATPTYCAMGLYTVDGSGNAALAAQCANDTTLFAGTFTTYIRSLNVPVQKIQGQRYAFGLLVVTAAATPNFSGYNGATASASLFPRLSGAFPGQAVLPASVLAGQVVNNSSMYFGLVTP
jgi:hypothetical protein